MNIVITDIIYSGSLQNLGGHRAMKLQIPLETFSRFREPIDINLLNLQIISVFIKSSFDISFRKIIHRSFSWIHYRIISTGYHISSSPFFLRAKVLDIHFPFSLSNSESLAMLVQLVLIYTIIIFLILKVRCIYIFYNPDGSY